MHLSHDSLFKCNEMVFNFKLESQKKPRLPVVGLQEQHSSYSYSNRDLNAIVFTLNLNLNILSREEKRLIIFTLKYQKVSRSNGLIYIRPMVQTLMNKHCKLTLCRNILGRGGTCTLLFAC